MNGHTRDTESECGATAPASRLGPSPSGAADGGNTRSIVVEAPAKLNLYLEILGRRDDGYHEIDTVMQTIDLADTLTLRARDDDEFTLSVAGRSEGVPADETNLVIKAARALVKEIRSRGDRPPLAGADIELLKRIPPGAGLGGGSSDAAATLVGLRRLWGLEVPDRLLEGLAARLGSDVPFFVKGGTARCTGRGEILEPLEGQGTMCAVLVLGEPLSTAQVYHVFSDIRLTTPHPGDMLPLCKGRTVCLGEVGSTLLRNALDTAAIQIRPSLLELEESLVRAGAIQACVSGSGSCVFGVAESEVHARRVASQVEDAGHECVVAKSVGPRCQGGGKHGSY